MKKLSLCLDRDQRSSKCLRPFVSDHDDSYSSYCDFTRFFLKSLYIKGPIVYFIEGRSQSRHLNRGFAFSRCLNGTFPWRKCFVNDFWPLTQKGIFVCPNIVELGEKWFSYSPKFSAPPHCAPPLFSPDWRPCIYISLIYLIEIKKSN